MSTPKIFPRDDDRSWTREFYYAINRVFRRIWYEQNMDAELKHRMTNLWLYGTTHPEAYHEYRR